MARRLTEYERQEAIKDFLRGKPGATATEVTRSVPGEYPTVARALRRLVGLGRVVAIREPGAKTIRHYAKDEPR